MIIDSLANASCYAHLSPLFAAGFEYLRHFDPNTPDGKYEIDGKKVFASVQRYETAPEDKKAWEAHRVYADIQYIALGHEKIFYTPVGNLISSVPYNEAKDVEKYANEVNGFAAGVVLSPGDFGIYLPQDAHKPGCLVDVPEPIVKVVVKVQVG